MELFMLNGLVVKAEGLVLRLHVVVPWTLYIRFLQAKKLSKKYASKFYSNNRR